MFKHIWSAFKRILAVGVSTYFIAEWFGLEEKLKAFNAEYWGLNLLVAGFYTYCHVMFCGGYLNKSMAEFNKTLEGTKRGTRK